MIEGMSWRDAMVELGRLGLPLTLARQVLADADATAIDLRGDAE